MHTYKNCVSGQVGIKLDCTKTKGVMMCNRKKRTKHAFTLIELLVVIAIIGLLLAVILPSLKRAKEITRQVICASRLRQIGVAMASYSQSNPGLPDAVDVNGDADFGHSYAVYRGGDYRGNGDDNYQYPNGKYIPLRWAKLYEGGYMDTPEIFYCPNNRMDLFKYESYSQPSPWGTLLQDYNSGLVDGTTHNQWIRVGYTYFPTPSGKPKWVTVHGRERLVLAEKFSQLHHTLPYATDVLHRRGVLSHQRSHDYNDDTYKESNKYSVNALYSDAHVANCNDQNVFKDVIWDTFQSNYDLSYLTVFQLIGVE